MLALGRARSTGPYVHSSQIYYHPYWHQQMSSSNAPIYRNESEGLQTSATGRNHIATFRKLGYTRYLYKHVCVYLVGGFNPLEKN